MAFAAFAVVSFVFGLLSDWLAPYLLVFREVQGSGAASKIVAQQMLVLNSFALVQSFLAYTAGAYVLKDKAFLPAAILYAAVTAGAIVLLRRIALPSDPSTTYLDLILENPAGWIGGAFAAVAGVLFGQWLARRRGSEQYAL